MEADDQRPRAGEPRAPAGQAVVGVDEVEGRALAQQPAQPPGRRDVLARAGREAEDLDLDLAPADLLDLVADPAAALRRAGVGLEVGDDQYAHRALSVSAGGSAHTRSANWRIRVWIGDARPAEHRAETTTEEASMIYALMGYLHAARDAAGAGDPRPGRRGRGARGRSSTSA